MDEKVTACHALGVFAEQTGALFVPYIDSVMKSFSDLEKHIYDEVRQAVVISMKRRNAFSVF